MPALKTDKFMKVGSDTVTTLEAPGKAIGAESITVGATTNYPTETGIVIAIRKVDSNGKLIAGTYTEWLAVVTSETTIEIDPTPVKGDDQVYPAGSTTQVFIPVSSYAQDKLVEGILVHANQDGTLKDDSVDTDQLKNGSVTSEKMAGSSPSWIISPELLFVSADGPTQILKAAGVDVREAFGEGTRLKYNQDQAISNYWSFDTNNADSKGSAVMQNIGTPTYTAGKFGNALTLNGSSQALSMTDSAALQLGKNGVEFTIGCWFKTSTAAGAKNIFQSFSLNTNYAGLYLDVNGTNLRLATGNNTGPAVASTITGATTVTDGNWHYAVATFRNNFGQLYLDGKLEASGYMITPAFAATNYVRVGCGNLSGSNVNWFNGQIDDLFLINGYALDEQTIAAKYGASPQTAQGTNDITITKKALVSTNAVLSDSDTLITIFSGTDYTAANSAITSPYYSPLKAPYGFPLSHEKWTVEYRLTDGTQGTPTQNQWYNLASNVMALPIGAWDVSYKFQLYANKGGSTFTAMNATLATAPNVETDPRFTTMVFGTGDPALGEVYMALPMSVKAKTNLYPNFKTGYASIGQILLDAAMPNLIRAKSALL